jgi:excisionase family DNA binding protein
MGEELMTIKEVADFLRLTPRSVWRWLNRGRLRPLRWGHTIRFRRADVIDSAEKYQYGDPEPKDDILMG